MYCFIFLLNSLVLKAKTHHFKRTDFHLKKYYSNSVKYVTYGVNVVLTEQK